MVSSASISTKQPPPDRISIDFGNTVPRRNRVPAPKLERFQKASLITTILEIKIALSNQKQEKNVVAQNIVGKSV